MKGLKIKPHNPYVEVSLTASDWQLYLDVSENVARVLNARFMVLVNGGTPREEVRRSMEQLMGELATHGANDTEPRWVLADMLDEVFGKERGA